VYGEHVWVDTSVSGDFCYVGETECTVSELSDIRNIGDSQGLIRYRQLISMEACHEYLF